MRRGRGKEVCRPLVGLHNLFAWYLPLFFCFLSTHISSVLYLGIFCRFDFFAGLSSLFWAVFYSLISSFFILLITQKIYIYIHIFLWLICSLDLLTKAVRKCLQAKYVAAKNIFLLNIACFLFTFSNVIFVASFLLVHFFCALYVCTYVSACHRELVSFASTGPCQWCWRQL